MKIRPVTTANRAKVYALLRSAFPGSSYEERLVRQLHDHDTPLHEWICIHTGKAIAYIAFSNAYHDSEICGLHLAPMAVAPDFQRQGVGSELLRFALRQDVIKNAPLYVLGEPGYYQKFGFEPCKSPVCPYDKNNAHFLSMRNKTTDRFIIGYEPEFLSADTTSRSSQKKRR